MQPEDGAGGVPGQPAHKRQQAAEQHIDGIVAGHRGRKALSGEFAAARSGDPDHGQRAQAAESVHGGRAADIEKTVAQRKVRAQRGEPSAGPDPMRGQREDDGGENRSRGAAGREPPAVRSRAPGQHRRHGDGQELEEQRKLSLRRGRAKPAQKKWARPSTPQVLPAGMNDDFDVAQSSRE